MSQYNIRYSKEAKQDLVDIKKYIKYNLQEPNIANKLITRIRKEVDRLTDNPDIYQIIDDDFIKKLDIRKIMVDNYIIFYRIKNKTVEVVRIMYARRNWIRLL